MYEVKVENDVMQLQLLMFYEKRNNYKKNSDIH